MLPPPLWEYTRAPWYFGLLVKKFRCDPQLALQVADVMHDKTNLPISRAEIKRQKQVGIAAARVHIPIVSNSIAPTARATVPSDCSSADGYSSSVAVVPSVQQKQLPWAKVTASKALKEKTNIAKRMRKMEELAQGMSLLEKMRQAIGPSFENEYKARVRTLYAALPDFNTFDNAVDVIDVDAEEDMMPTFKPRRGRLGCRKLRSSRKWTLLCQLKLIKRILSVERNGWWICFLNPLSMHRQLVMRSIFQSMMMMEILLALLFNQRGLDWLLSLLRS